MATESPLLHDGAQNVSGFDARNSTNTGSTQRGPNGSAQFLAVRQSTSVDRTVMPCTAAGIAIYGILQNKPSTGIAADVGIFGVTKAVGGSSAIAPGMALMVSSSGDMIPFTTGNVPIGTAIEACAAVGQVFSMALYGFGMGGVR